MEEVKKQGMESLFCPYELALELKELGFNEGVLAQYRVDGYLCWGKDDCSLGSDISDEDYKNNCFPEFGCRAPLYQQGINFLLNKLNGHYCITFYKDETGYITDNRVDYLEYDFENFTECLKKLINIIK